MERRVVSCIYFYICNVLCAWCVVYSCMWFYVCMCVWFVYVCIRVCTDAFCRNGLSGINSKGHRARTTRLRSGSGIVLSLARSLPDNTGHPTSVWAWNVECTILPVHVFMSVHCLSFTLLAYFPSSFLSQSLPLYTLVWRSFQNRDPCPIRLRRKNSSRICFRPVLLKSMSSKGWRMCKALM